MRLVLQVRNLKAARMQCLFILHVLHGTICSGFSDGLINSICNYVARERDTLLQTIFSLISVQRDFFFSYTKIAKCKMKTV